MLSSSPTEISPSKQMSLFIGPQEGQQEHPLPSQNCGQDLCSDCSALALGISVSWLPVLRLYLVFRTVPVKPCCIEFLEQMVHDLDVLLAAEDLGTIVLEPTEQEVFSTVMCPSELCVLTQLECLCCWVLFLLLLINHQSALISSSTTFFFPLLMDVNGCCCDLHRHHCFVPI